MGYISEETKIEFPLPCVMMIIICLNEALVRRCSRQNWSKLKPSPEQKLKTYKLGQTQMKLRSLLL